MNKKTTKKERELDALNAKLLQYIKLLGEELNELIPLATNHHWQSTRVEQGVRARWGINDLAKKLGKGNIL